MSTDAAITATATPIVKYTMCFRHSGQWVRAETSASAAKGRDCPDCTMERLMRLVIGPRTDGTGGTA